MKSYRLLAYKALSSDQKKKKEDYLWSLDQTGELFLKDVLKYGSTYSGEALEFEQWHKEYYQFLGSLWIHRHIVSGAAQIGKTLACTILWGWLLARLKLNIIWAYSQKSTRDKNVPSQWWSYFPKYLKRINEVNDRQKTQTKELYQFADRFAYFIYATPPQPSREGLAEAGGSAVGMSGDICLLEERSQFPPGTDSPIFDRIRHSRVETLPQYLIGTPGGGSGIEVEIEKADRHFYPHCICENCKQTIPLHPLGALLKPTKRRQGENVNESFFTGSGAPLTWHHKDPQQATKSAYFGCPRCGRELPKEARVKNSFFVCLRTGQPLAQFLQEKDRTADWKCAITLSPLLRDTEYNLAAQLIEDGLSTSNTANWQQQGLGIPSRNTTNQVTIEQIRDAINAPVPVGARQFTLMGIDQGRHQNWGIIVDFHLPPNWETASAREILNQSIRVVRWAGATDLSHTTDLIEEYAVDWGLIDSKPSTESAATFCEEIGFIELADQVAPGSVKSYEFSEGKAWDMGESFNVWKVRSGKYLQSVCAGFFDSAYDGFPLYRLPPDWKKWERQRTEYSPIRHLMAVKFNPEANKWERPRDHVDDIFFACHFLEAAAEIYLIEDFLARYQ